MQPGDYRRIVKQHASLDPDARLGAYQKAARDRDRLPLSPWERRISAALGSRAKAKGFIWYHGGVAGREVGDVLLPSSVTGMNPRGSPSGFWEARERVYVTHYREGAEFFARSNEGFGAESRIYVVEPQGALTSDPETLRLVLLLQEEPALKERHLAHIGDFLSRFCCKSAEVVAVLEVEEAPSGFKPSTLSAT